LTVHGHAREFAEDLRRQGIEAWALGEGNQLELSIALPAKEARTVPRIAEVEPVAGGSFGDFAQLCEQIGRLTGKLKKVELLANYLSKLPESDLRVACIFLTGRAFSRADTRTLQVGWSVVRKGLLQATKLTESEFRRIASAYGDAGKIAYEALLSRTAPRLNSLAEARNWFERLEQARGPVAKASILAEWLHHSNALNGSYVIRILTGDLRIGLKEGLVEEGIAQAFTRSAEDVREAHMLTGDLGETALLAERNLLTTAKIALFRPVMSMLAIPEPTAEAAAERLKHGFAATPAFAEQKFDGVRAQLHAAPDRVEVYSRDLHNISQQFPELAGLSFSQSLILDGEIIAFDGNKKLTFFDLQRRLGRKRIRDLFDTDDIPIAFMAFDLLLLDRRSLVREPLESRRSLLEALSLPKLIQLLPNKLVATAGEIEAAFIAARDLGSEGLMLKDPASSYQPGRRGGSWIKLKRELATLDVVVVGAEQGHGRRSHVLSDYTFAVRNSENGRLETIGKAYSGLTDAEIEELTEHFQRRPREKLGGGAKSCPR
jgi:DNA ligase 1